MALEVKFTVATPSLRFQEDSVCVLKLTNTGREAVQLSNPAMTPTLPRLKLLNVKTGVERLFQRTRPGGAIPPREQPLGPGKGYEYPMMLLDLPGDIEPGEYDVSLGCRYNKGAEVAESAAVRVKIRPTTPRNLNIEGTGRPVLYGAWVNLGEDPPEIVRMRFDALRGGGARDLRPGPKAGLLSVPVVSLAPNRQACPHHYVAWLDGAELKFFHLHETQGASPVRAVPLPGGDVRIVGPLHSDPTPDSGGRPAGGLLLWMGERDKPDSQLQALKLTEASATAQARTPLPGVKPSWMGSFVRSDGRRLVLLAQAAGGLVSLSVVPWPGVPGALKKLGEWKGALAGLGYSLETTDVLHGSLLLRSGLEPADDLDRIDFSLDAADGFAAKPQPRITIDPQDPVAQSIVRLSGQGSVAALLKGASGSWSIYHDGAVTPLADPLKSSKFPLDLCFMDNTTPVVIAGGKDSGFRLQLPGGGPLPPRPG